MTATTPVSIRSKQHERKVISLAIKKADKGEFISNESMRTWFASLGTDNELPRPKPNISLKEKS